MKKGIMKNLRASNVIGDAGLLPESMVLAKVIFNTFSKPIIIVSATYIKTMSNALQPSNMTP